MKINDAFPSRYLKAADLNGGQINVEISSCATAEVGQGDDSKMMPVVEFKGDTKSMVFNKTNWNTLMTAFGGIDTEEWSGRQITLFVAQVPFKDKVVDGIRVLIPDQEQRTAPDSKRMNLDEEVPF